MKFSDQKKQTPLYLGIKNTTQRKLIFAEGLLLGLQLNV